MDKPKSRSPDGERNEWLHKHWAITIVGRFPFLRLRRVSYSNIGGGNNRVWDCICGHHA